MDFSNEALEVVFVDLDHLLCGPLLVGFICWRLRRILKDGLQELCCLLSTLIKAEAVFQSFLES
jgi:hypothetical protein